MSKNRKQSYVCTESIAVLFDGSKSFWKTRTNLDILIVEHSRQLCIELVAFNAVLGIEAPRIYMSSLLLASKIDQDEVKEKLTEKKEALIRMKRNVNVTELTKEVTVAMIVQYILSRLSIPNDMDPNTLVVVLQPQSTDKIVDVETQRMDIIIDKPPALVPLDVAYQKKVTAGEFQAALNNLANESLKLQEATKIADMVISSVDGFKLMMAEKMRIELEIRRKYSVPRLRWVKAINRVLIQNYIAKITERLERMDAEKELAAREEAMNSNNAKNGKPTRVKILRKSIDNSQLNRLPNLRAAGADGLLIGIPGSSSQDHGDRPSGSQSMKHLPVISPSGGTALTAISERRKSKMVASSGASSKDHGGGKNNEKTPMLRRSFGQEHYPQYSTKSERIRGSSFDEPEPAVQLGSSPPSLIKSYNTMSGKLLQPLSSSHAGGGGEKERSVRIAGKA